MVRRALVMRWLLMRGWSREVRHWGGFFNELREAFPGARIEAADLPGNGSRHCERSPTCVAALTDSVRQAVGRHPGERLNLVGLSLGGMVCLDWAARYPDEVSACVLINSSMRPLSGFYDRLRPRNYPRLARALWTVDATEREAIVLGLTSNRPAENHLRAWAMYAAERPVRRLNALRQLLAAARFRIPSTPPAVPILLLASSRDRLVSPRCSTMLAESWGVPLAVHPTAGHDMALDDGPWVAGEIRRWLGSLA